MGYTLRYLMATYPSNRVVYKEAIDRGVNPDSVFVAYSEDALQVVAAWRTTKLHYEFDPDFYDALASTPMKGTPPSQTFKHLPAKAFFLSRRGGICIDADGTRCHGFFVVVFDDKLLIAPLTNNSVSSGKFLMRLNQDSVESVLDRVCAEMLESSIRVIQAHPNGADIEKIEAIDQVRKDWKHHEKRFREALGGALSCLMYLCTEKPDIDHHRIPAAKTIHMGNRVRFVPAKQETLVTVGIRLGSLFRKHIDSENQAAQARGISSGNFLPPHIRRAHWHTYWVGKRSEPKPELRWLHPILVNAESSDQLTETVHRVQTEIETKPMKPRAF